MAFLNEEIDPLTLSLYWPLDIGIYIYFNSLSLQSCIVLTILHNSLGTLTLEYILCTSNG